jgi:hypothetical protein
MADQVTWTTADGTVIYLTDTDSGYDVLGDGTRGLRSVEYEVATQKYAGVDGEAVQAVRAVGNQPTVGLLIYADTEADFRARARGLRNAMRPKAGMGVLGVRNSSGELRELACYCTGGFEGDEAPDVSAPGHWWKLALKFYAPVPWWQGDPQTVSLGLGAPTTNFFPMTPMTLAASAVQGSFSVDLSACDAPVPPTWTVNGPGSTLILTNVTTGRVIQVNTSLLSTDTLVINTAPGAQSIRRGDGTNLMGSLASDPALWPLIEDVNNVTAQLTGATSASRITATYRPRYAGI